MNARIAALKTRLNDLRHQIPYLPQALSIVWRAARGWTIAWAFLLIIQGVLPVASVYLTRAVVDSLVAALDAEALSLADWETLKSPLLYAGLMGLVLLLTESLRSITTWVRTAQSQLVGDHIHEMIHTQALALDLSFYDSSEYYDILHRARIDAMSKPVALLENFGALVQNGITLVAMGGVLLSYSVWLPLILLGSTLPALWVVARSTIRFHGWRLRNTKNERRARYLDWMLTDRRAAAEMRLFDLGKTFRDNFQTLRGQLRNERLLLFRDQMWTELVAGVIALTVTALALAWIIYRVVIGLFSLGDLALFYQAFNQGQRVIRTLLSNVGDIYRNLFFLENLFEFLAIQPKVSQPAQPQKLPAGIQQEIVIQNVDFSYPGAQRQALADFSLTIPAGQIVSIVGENGAGKSTLIKLLCRFYDPQKGQVSFDGIDLRHISPLDIRRMITVLFQQPVQYQDTVTNNIAFGDLAADPQRAEIESAAKAAGAAQPIAKLSDGYETVLGRWFGRGELSVGEWQRIALARAFLRQASLIILDEPTSAMDSWAEADWLSRFRELVAGQTALIITHRFTTAMQADVIRVMDQGRIIESGTHEQLMEFGGRYAQSWLQQTQNANLSGEKGSGG